MSQLPTTPLAEQADADLTALAPLTIIRTETVLSRLPIHNLAKKGRVQIKITRKNAQGEIELYWQVSPNAAYGEPRHLAYKLDTIVINQRIHALGRPLPKVLRLGSIAQICRDLAVVIGGSGHASVKKAFLQNAATFLTAKLRYTATDGTERTLEAGFTRYSVVFTGERLPDGTIADAVYLILNEPYWEVLNHAPIRPLDYDYLQALPPAAQRCYEILSYILFAALKYGHAEARLLYSEYCTFSAQQRYADYPHEGSGQIRAKIYAKLEPFPVQSGTRELREVFHTVLRDTVGVTDPTRVQSILPIEDHVVPANRADVRQQGGINALFHRVPVAQHRINLPDLPVDDRRQDEHQTAGPTHLLLPIASLCLPPFAIVDVAR